MKLKQLHTAGIGMMFASLIFAADFENFNNPSDETFTLTEDLNATGGDAVNYGTFIVDGTNLTIKAEANFANRNGESEFRLNENSSLTILVKEGVWNESYNGEGSGTINLLKDSALYIGNSENIANFNNNNDAVLKMASGSIFSVSGNLSNNGNAQIDLIDGSTLEILGNLSINDDSLVKVTGSKIENSGGELAFGGGEDKAGVLILSHSILNTSSFSTGAFWEGKSKATIELENSTINSVNDSSNWGIMNVSGTSFLNFQNTLNDESGNVSYRQLFNDGALNLAAGTNFKIDGTLTNESECSLEVKEGSTLEVVGDFWLNGSSQAIINASTVKNGGNLYSDPNSTAVLTLKDSRFETNSFVIGVNSQDKVESTLNLSASTISTKNDSTNRGLINVDETSSVIFGEGGRALFNRQGGTIKIKSNQSLDISRVR